MYDVCFKDKSNSLTGLTCNGIWRRFSPKKILKWQGFQFSFRINKQTAPKVWNRNISCMKSWFSLPVQWTCWKKDGTSTGEFKGNIWNLQIQRSSLCQSSKKTWAPQVPLWFWGGLSNTPGLADQFHPSFPDIHANLQGTCTQDPRPWGCTVFSGWRMEVGLSKVGKHVRLLLGNLKAEDPFKQI